MQMQISDKIYRFGAVGIGFLFILIGSALLWHTNADKVSKDMGLPDDTRHAINWSVLTSWIFTGLSAASIFLRQDNRPVSDLLLFLSMIVMFGLFAGFDGTSASSMYTITDNRQRLREAKKNDRSDKDVEKHMEQIVSGGAMLALGLFVTYIGTAFEKLRLDMAPSALCTAGAVASGFIGALILWANKGIADMHDPKHPGGGSSTMYFYTAAFILALFFNILSVVGSSRTSAQLNLAYSGLFAVFGLSYTLSIAGEVLPGNRSAARAGGVFVWISFIAMTASSHFVLQEVEDSRPSADYEEYYEEAPLPGNEQASTA